MAACAAPLPTNSSPPAPQSTYRLQLHAGFGFDDVARVADYLERLGISHVYCSPYLQAAAGSTHGYDVVDPRRVNRELGGEAGHNRMCEALGHAELLTWDGEGHTSYLQGSSCIDNYVNAYLVSQTLPPANTTCPK